MDLKSRFGAALIFFSILWPQAQVTGHEERKQTNGTNPEVSFDQQVGAQIPLDLIFADDNGRQGTLSEHFGGKPVLLALVYYNCPQICPLVLDGLARSLRPLSFAAGDDYRVVAISIDPRETPELARGKKQSVMARSRPDAAAGWHLLTGDETQIKRLAQAVGFRYAENERSDRDRYIHAAGMMVVTPEGKISRYFYGFDFPPRDLRFALIEASGNRIGSAIDQLLLLCYRYDPSQGKYTLAILNILRLSGLVTALGLGAFLMIQLRRERRNRPSPARGMKVNR